MFTVAMQGRAPSPDLIMTPSWRLLGPLEATNGTLPFGVSTAMIFGVMLWLIQARFTDLKA
jgi:hypothetical protein